jgi:hypothetical protein
MVQILARVVSLKRRQEYEQALREIDAALRELGAASAGTSSEVSLDEWIALCRKHEQAASGLLVAVADLLKEQGDVFALQSKPVESHQARTLALGLLLEALIGGETFVSAELLAKVDELLDVTSDSSLPPEVLRRLVNYFEARGQFAKAEDLLFVWLESGDTNARAQGRAFYERLLAVDDAELERGGLPRAEVEQGKREWIKAS